MAEYSKLYITNNGQALMAKMIAGSGNIDFTKVCSSSTQYTESQLQALTALSNIKQTTLVSKVTRTNEVAIKIDAAYSNVDLKEGYYMRTLGLYAVDPDKGEILYAVCIEKSNNCYMPPYNGVTVSAAYLQLKYCDSSRLSEKYIEPIQPYADRYYKDHIKKGGKKHERVRKSTQYKAA